MKDWDPSKPNEMTRSFHMLFRPFFRKHDVQVGKWTPELDTRIKDFFKTRISQDLTEKQWKSLVRRFKSQYKEYFEIKTTFNSTNDGWLVGDSIVGKKVNCLFYIRNTKTHESYTGIVSSQSNTILHSIFKKIQPSTYTIRFDDGEIFDYNIFRIEGHYYRVGTRRLTISKMTFEPEPEPCNDPYKKICAICMVQCVNTVCVPCGHACMCKGCAKRVFGGRAMCPICQQHIQFIQHLYYSGKDNNEEIDRLKSEIDKLKSNIESNIESEIDKLKSNIA